MIIKSFVNKRQKKNNDEEIKFNAGKHHCIQNSKRNIWFLSSNWIFGENNNNNIEISKVQIFKRSINEAYVLNRSISIVSFSFLLFFFSCCECERSSFHEKQANQ